MRPKKPIHVSIEQVRITRDGPTAVIEFADQACGGVDLTIGAATIEAIRIVGRLETLALDGVGDARSRHQSAIG